MGPVPVVVREARVGRDGVDPRLAQPLLGARERPQVREPARQTPNRAATAGGDGESRAMQAVRLTPSARLLGVLCLRLSDVLRSTVFHIATYGESSRHPLPPLTPRLHCITVSRGPALSLPLPLPCLSPLVCQPTSRPWAGRSSVVPSTTTTLPPTPQPAPPHRLTTATASPTTSTSSRTRARPGESRVRGPRPVVGLCPWTSARLRGQRPAC